MLLSYVVDSAIELSTELGDYDHLVFTNPKWIENFGDSGKLKPIEYSSLSKSMQEFLDSQMPILTNDGSVLPEGTGLYEYEGGGLLAFPINVTLGSAKPIEAKNPLVMLIDNPAEILKADSCMLPLTSSGNVLFWIAIIYNKLLKIVSLKITEIFKSLIKITFYNYITNPRGQSRKSTVLFLCL